MLFIELWLKNYIESWGQTWGISNYLDEPWKVIGKTNSYLMMPEEPWEQHGNCDNTIFPCGAIADYEKDQIRLYYGACDYAICLATGSLSETVHACLEGL